jgi:hypothetical protein
MHQNESLASDLIANGFTKDSQKRGVIRWLLGFSMAMNIFLIYALLGQASEERKASQKHEAVLHEIIKMQSKTEQKVDTLLKKQP